MRTANEQLGRSTRGRPRPWLVVTRTVDPIMTVLRERRLSIGLTQVDLAERIGIAEATVNGCETGRNSPRLDTLRAWAESLGMRLRVETDDE